MRTGAPRGRAGVRLAPAAAARAPLTLDASELAAAPGAGTCEEDSPNDFCWLAASAWPGDAAVAALCVGAVLGAALFLQPLWVRGPTLAWPFWIPLSASVTAGVAWLLSRLSSHRSPPRLETSN